MVESKLLPSQQELHQALDYDPVTGVFRWRYRPEMPQRWNTRWVGKVAGRLKKSTGRIDIRLNYEFYGAHRLAWVYVRGDIPSGFQIDHKSLNPADNSIENLRLASPSQNSMNGPVRLRNRSGFKGVMRCLNRWRSQIKVNGRNIHLGVFDTAEEAHAAYVRAAEQYFGAFARAA